MSRPARRARAAGAAALALAVLAGGCSDGDDAAERPATEPSRAVTERPPVATAVTWGRVTGVLPRDRRAPLAHEVREVVDRWTDAAYLGDYPRRDFSRAFPGFTRGAATLAHRDQRLMSNEAIGRRIDGVRATARKVRIDALAVHQRAVGVTAHVFLAFRTTGHLERRYRVAARLYLTRTDSGWKVFGYDATKGAV